MKLTSKKFYRSDIRWPDGEYNDILIECHDNSNMFEAIIEMPSFVRADPDKISPRLCIYVANMALLPMLTEALLTLPDPTTKDDLCAALVAVGLKDATNDAGDSRE